MADNFQLDLGSGGDIASADDLGGGVKVQRVKVQHGPDGSATDAAQATPFPVDDHGLLISRGLITGQMAIHEFGHNSDVDTGTPEDVWDAGGDMDWPTAAAVVSVTSSSTNDDGSPAGTGAHTLTIEGLDSSFNEQTETITLNGTTAVTTSASFVRVNKAYVVAVGAYHGANAGLITATISGNTAFTIPADEGETHLGRYTVPNGKKGYLQAVYITVDSSKTADVAMFESHDADVVSTPFGSLHEVLRFDAISGEDNFTFKNPHEIEGKADMWMRVLSVAANNTSVSCDFELTVVDD